MSFLQAKHDLADVHDTCVSRRNLGLGNMAIQMSNDVHIDGGKIHLNETDLRIRPTTPFSQNAAVLCLDNDDGEVKWKNYPVVEWSESNQNEIKLSDFLDDLNYVTPYELQEAIDSVDTTIPTEYDALYVSNLRIDDLVMEIDPGENAYLQLLTIPRASSNVDFMRLINITHDRFSTFTESVRSESVPSLQTLFNIYSYFQSEVARLKQLEHGGLLLSGKNLQDLDDPQQAVANLGLNDALKTIDLTFTNLFADSQSLTDNITEQFETNNPLIPYFPQFGGRIETKAKFRSLKILQNYYDNREDDLNPYSAAVIYNHIESVAGTIDDSLLTANSFSEFLEPDKNGERLQALKNLQLMGLKEVCFTSNYYDLDNRPIQLSAFSNDDTRFLYSISNLEDLQDPALARHHLELETIAHTGKFDDLRNIPTVIFDMVYNDNYAFFARESNLYELSGSESYFARSNLGCGDIATQNISDVFFTGGTVTLNDTTVTDSLILKPSNVNFEVINGAISTNKYAVLHLVDTMGGAKWDMLPEADPYLDKIGMTYLTNDHTVQLSNYAPTSYALSNLYFGEINDRLNRRYATITTSNYNPSSVIMSNAIYEINDDRSFEFIINWSRKQNQYLAGTEEWVDITTLNFVSSNAVLGQNNFALHNHIHLIGSNVYFNYSNNDDNNYIQFAVNEVDTHNSGLVPQMIQMNTEWSYRQSNTRILTDYGDMWQKLSQLSNDTVTSLKGDNNLILLKMEDEDAWHNDKLLRGNITVHLSNATTDDYFRQFLVTHENNPAEWVKLEFHDIHDFSNVYKRDVWMLNEGFTDDKLIVTDAMYSELNAIVDDPSHVIKIKGELSVNYEALNLTSTTGDIAYTNFNENSGLNSYTMLNVDGDEITVTREEFFRHVLVKNEEDTQETLMDSYPTTWLMAMYTRCNYYNLSNELIDHMSDRFANIVWSNYTDPIFGSRYTTQTHFETVKELFINWDRKHHSYLAGSGEWADVTTLHFESSNTDFGQTNYSLSNNIHLIGSNIYFNYWNDGTLKNYLEIAVNEVDTHNSGLVPQMIQMNTEWSYRQSNTRILTDYGDMWQKLSQLSNDTVTSLKGDNNLILLKMDDESAWHNDKLLRGNITVHLSNATTDDSFRQFLITYDNQPAEWVKLEFHDIHDFQTVYKRYVSMYTNMFDDFNNLFDSPGTPIALPSGHPTLSEDTQALLQDSYPTTWLMLTYTRSNYFHLSNETRNVIVNEGNHINLLTLSRSDFPFVNQFWKDTSVYHSSTGHDTWGAAFNNENSDASGFAPVMYKNPEDLIWSARYAGIMLFSNLYRLSNEIADEYPNNRTITPYITWGNVQLSLNWTNHDATVMDSRLTKLSDLADYVNKKTLKAYSVSAVDSYYTEIHDSANTHLYKQGFPSIYWTSTFSSNMAAHCVETNVYLPHVFNEDIHTLGLLKDPLTMTDKFITYGALSNILWKHNELEQHWNNQDTRQIVYREMLYDVDYGYVENAWTKDTGGVSTTSITTYTELMNNTPADGVYTNKIFDETLTTRMVNYATFSNFIEDFMVLPLKEDGVFVVKSEEVRRRVPRMDTIFNYLEEMNYLSNYGNKVHENANLQTLLELHNENRLITTYAMSNYMFDNIFTNNNNFIPAVDKDGTQIIVNQRIMLDGGFDPRFLYTNERVTIVDVTPVFSWDLQIVLGHGLNSFIVNIPTYDDRHNSALQKLNMVPNRVPSMLEMETHWKYTYSNVVGATTYTDFDNADSHMNTTRAPSIFATSNYIEHFRLVYSTSLRDATNPPNFNVTNRSFVIDRLESNVTLGNVLDLFDKEGYAQYIDAHSKQHYTNNQKAHNQLMTLGSMSNFLHESGVEVDVPFFYDIVPDEGTSWDDLFENMGSLNSRTASMDVMKYIICEMSNLMELNVFENVRNRAAQLDFFESSNQNNDFDQVNYSSLTTSINKLATYSNLYGILGSDDFAAHDGTFYGEILWNRRDMYEPVGDYDTYLTRKREPYELITTEGLNLFFVKKFVNISSSAHDSILENSEDYTNSKKQTSVPSIFCMQHYSEDYFNYRISLNTFKTHIFDYLISSHDVLVYDNVGYVNLSSPEPPTLISIQKNEGFGIQQNPEDPFWSSNIVTPKILETFVYQNAYINTWITATNKSIFDTDVINGAGSSSFYKIYGHITPRSLLETLQMVTENTTLTAGTYDFTASSKLITKNTLETYFHKKLITHSTNEGSDTFTNKVASYRKTQELVDEYLSENYHINTYEGVLVDSFNAFEFDQMYRGGRSEYADGRSEYANTRSGSMQVVETFTYDTDSYDMYFTEPEDGAYVQPTENVYASILSSKLLYEVMMNTDSLLRMGSIYRLINDFYEVKRLSTTNFRDLVTDKMYSDRMLIGSGRIDQERSYVTVGGDSREDTVFEVNKDGSTVINGDLFLGHRKWKLSFDEDYLRISKYEPSSRSYVDKHVFT
jgi:hypothetical protein